MEPGPSTTKRGRPADGSGQVSCIASAWNAYERELLAYLRHRLPDADAAADVLQDVFVKAMRQGQGFCRLDNPRAWLFQVARNALADRARTAHPAEPLPEGADEPAAPPAETIAPVDALTVCLARTLGELPADDAAILRACDLGGQTVRDFAEAHALSLPAAKSRLLRARQRLRQRLTTACRVSFDVDGSVAGFVRRPPSD